MGKSKVVGLNPKSLEQKIVKDYIDAQKKALTEYAESKVQEIGDEIKSYHGRHNMDRTGNLLDSLCWGVSYSGKLSASGFYRPAQANSQSGLHEWSTVSFKDKVSGRYQERINADEPVNGHQLAQDYIEKYGNSPSQGWKVFFAILAPYWGYWEKGFTIRTFGGTRILQFAVMTQFFDQVKSDLKPMRTRIRISVPKYASKSLYAQARKNWYG